MQYGTAYLNQWPIACVTFSIFLLQQAQRFLVAEAIRLEHEFEKKQNDLDFGAIGVLCASENDGNWRACQ